MTKGPGPFFSMATTPVRGLSRRASGLGRLVVRVARVPTYLVAMLAGSLGLVAAVFAVAAVPLDGWVGQAVAALVLLLTLSPCGEFVAVYFSAIQHGWLGFGLLSLVLLALLVLGVALSNLVSNVPAVMLLLPHLGANASEAGMMLALVSTFAGNLLLVGSIANLIVADLARQQGIEIDWKRHAVTGIPVTLATLAVVWGWMRWAG